MSEPATLEQLVHALRELVTPTQAPPPSEWLTLQQAYEEWGLTRNSKRKTALKKWFKEKGLLVGPEGDERVNRFQWRAVQGVHSEPPSEEDKAWSSCGIPTQQ